MKSVSQTEIDAFSVGLMASFFVWAVGSGLNNLVLHWWFPLVTPWRMMGLGGLPVGLIVLVWAWRLDDVRLLIAVGLGCIALAATAFLIEPVLYAANGFFDRGALTPCRVVVLKAEGRMSKVRVELPSGPIEKWIGVSNGQVQNGDTFTLHVGRGALGIPWYRHDEGRAIDLPVRVPHLSTHDADTRPSSHKETPR